MFDLAVYLALKQKIINLRLNEILDSYGDSSRILEAMRYSLNAGGKRIRPILSMAAAEAVGGNAADVLPIACAIEMIHTYSLIHDDLPAMDNDALRRGKPTSHIQFDEATAILAGDALLTLAFEMLSSQESSAQILPAVRLEIINTLSRAAGCRGMIEGQMRDILSEGRELAPHELESIHLLKTGALIQASVCVGALVSKGNNEDVDKLRTYAKYIGLAFQVMDDILNVKGDPSLLGKAVGSDARRGKNTYPAVIGLEPSEQYASRLIKTGLHAVRGFDNKADPLRAIAEYIIERTR
jgi:geranylgeranyl diphosphate synthase type II